VTDTPIESEYNKVKRTHKFAAGAALAVLFLSACANETTPVETAPAVVETTPAVGAEVSGMPCVVSDMGGFDDRSFNQLAFEGVQAAASQLGTDMRSIQSADAADFQSNLESLVDEGCTVVVAVGFQLAAATWQVATAHPDVHFLLIDHDGFNDGNPPPANLRPILFNTAEAAFLAGYLSAGVSETGIVGTFGGMNFPTVSIFMDGFRQGVEHYNAENGANVQVIGWDGSDGMFTGGFTANPEALTVAQTIVGQGVDVLLPVGGPIYQSGMVAIRDSGRDIALIGVDADLFYTDEATRDILLTSILKNIDEATKSTIIDAMDGTWDNTPYIGTLENGSVGIAPFHNLSDRVDADLAARVEAIRQGIIDGSIPVHSYLD
jgi:basic membrane protein A